MNEKYYEEMKLIVEDKGCELLTTKDEFSNLKQEQNVSPSKVKLNIKCSCKESYSTTYGQFKKKAYKCPKCRGRHGLSHTKIYRIFGGMKTRCYNEKTNGYSNYGGRGIKICEEWLNKENGAINFYNWSLGNGYEEGLSIDRINVDGNYEPSNCRWITMFDQQSNKRNNHYLTIAGETKHIFEWQRISGIGNTTMLRRIKFGWKPEDIISSASVKLSEKQSDFEGVTWNKTRERWKCMASGIENNKSIFIGWYYTKEKSMYAKFVYELNGIKIHNSNITNDNLKELNNLQEEYIKMHNTYHESTNNKLA